MKTKTENLSEDQVLGKDTSVKVAKFSFSRRQYTLGAIGVLAIAVLLAVLIALLFRQTNTAFRINNEYVSKSTYNNLVALAAKHKVKASDAGKQILAIYKDKYVARQIGISVSIGQIENEVKSQFLVPPNSSLDAWEVLIGWEASFHDQLKLAQSGGYSGYLFYYPFNYLKVKVFYNSPPPDGFGDQVKISQAQTQAQNQANSDRAQLQTGKITPDQVLNNLTNSNTLVFAGSNNDSMAFTIDPKGFSEVNGQLSVQLPDFVVSAITNLGGKAGLSPILTETNTYPDWELYNGESATQDIAYYYVDITKIYQANPKLTQEYNSDFAKLRVKTYEKI